MNADSLDTLNARFGIPDRLHLEPGPGGLPMIHVTAPSARAEICLHGAHVTAFQPAGTEPVLWLSPETAWDPARAIRGGIPVCWPWFGNHPDDDARPAHGFARTSCWEISATSQPDPGAVRVELTLPAPEPSRRALFAPAFDLTLAITVSTELSLALTTTNRSGAPFEITEALHTYLNVGAIDAVRCEGLDGVRYRDKMDAYREKRQAGDLVFEAATDRVYEDTTSDVLVHDDALGRTLRIAKSGSDTTVIWNPWSGGAAKLADLPDDGYRTMLCVEAANAGKNIVTLEPGATHALATTIGLETPPA